MKLFLVVIWLSASVPALGNRAVDLAKRELGPAVVLPRPIPAGRDRSTCSGKWNAEGYVCDRSRLLTLSANDAKAISQGVAHYTTMLSSVRDLLLTMERISIAHCRRHNIPYNNFFQHHMQKQMDQGAVNAQAAAAQRCWGYMTKVRNSALCSVCSARNFEFFLGQKAGLGLRSCHGILNECDVYFKDLNDLLGMYSLLEGSFKKSPVFHSIQSDFGRSVNYRREFFQLSRLVTNYFETRSESSAVAICESLVNLREQPKLFTITRMLSQIVGEFSRSVAKISQQRALTIESEASRKLDLFAGAFYPFSNGPLLQSDCIVVDPRHGNGNVRPMNLTMAFF